MGRVILRKEKVLKRKVKKESICPRQDRKRARERERERERERLVGWECFVIIKLYHQHSFIPPPPFCVVCFPFVYSLYIMCAWREIERDLENHHVIYKSQHRFYSHCRPYILRRRTTRSNPILLRVGLLCLSKRLSFGSLSTFYHTEMNC
jgi:hypothetical protein